MTRSTDIWMAQHGWDIQPDGVTYRDRSVQDTCWIEHAGVFGWKMFQVTRDPDTLLSERRELTGAFANPVALVIYLELEKSNG